MSKVIGIDLGSTASEIAIIEGGKATVIANEDGNYLTPSVVLIKDGERKVGTAAKRQQIVHPKNTVYLIKRFMGSTYAESSEAIKHVQYDIVEENGKPRVKIDDRTFSPEEISSYILALPFLLTLMSQVAGSTMTRCPSSVRRSRAFLKISR